PVPLAELPPLLMQPQMPRGQRLRIRTENRERGTIEAGLRARFIGVPAPFDFTQINVMVRRINDGTSRIHIDALPNHAFEVYDMAKNLTYVSELADYIRRETAADHSRLIDAEDDLDHTRAAGAEDMSQQSTQGR
ncbi:MAG: hypothetical protein AAF125_22115, partial [Chloroflexota bacterium]